jgi:NADH:ubiquinone oxidoreductase subunit B-like Fe-S oxidoreductase
MSLLKRTQLPRLQPVKFVLNWGRRYSLWLLDFGLGSCVIEPDRSLDAQSRLSGEWGLTERSRSEEPNEQ